MCDSEFRITFRRPTAWRREIERAGESDELGVDSPVTASPDSTLGEEPLPSDADEPVGNAGRWGRVAATAIGGSLVLDGVRRRSLGGLARAAAGAGLIYYGVTGHSPLDRPFGNAVDDLSGGARPTTVVRSITVGVDPEELEAYWIEPEHLSRLLGPALDIEAVGEDRIRCTVDGPFGRERSWECELTAHEPGESLRWETDRDASIRTDLSVRFRPHPNGRGTQVTVELRVEPPGGRIGTVAMDRLGFVPESLAGTALDRFKSLAETGEIPTLEKNPSARGSGDLV